MKFSIIIQAIALTLFSQLVYATAMGTRAVSAANQTQTFEDLVAYQLPDGRRRIDFYDNGALEGYAIETDAGGKSLNSFLIFLCLVWVLTQLPATFYDVDGTEVDLNDDTHLNKRISKWRLALKFAKLIAKWGKRAWDYIYCVGANTMWKCADDVSYFWILTQGVKSNRIQYLQCAQEGTPPWKCIEGIVCVGAAAKRCA
jgi:hypothetical protein